MQCGAKTRSGKPCKNDAMPNGRCRMHGGKSLRGAAHPNFKDGLRSKYMPKVLAPAFAAAAGDPELLNLTESIATQEAIVADLLASLDGAEAPTRLVGRIRKEWNNLWAATARGDGEAVGKHRAAITGLIDEATTAAATIDRIQVAEDTKRRLVETEMKRREKMREQVLMDDAVLLYRQLVEANRRAILEHPSLERDDAIRLLNAIVGQFAAIAGLPNRGDAGTGND